MTNQVIIEQVGQSTVEVKPNEQTAIEVGLTNVGIQGPVGPQGPQGVPGPNEIGGLPVVLSDAQPLDILQIKTGAWRNFPQERLTDGGNF